MCEISRGTAEWICAKFIWKTCLVPRLDEFDDRFKGQRSRSPGTKNGIFWPFWCPACGLFVKTFLAVSFFLT